MWIAEKREEALGFTQDAFNWGRVLPMTVRAGGVVGLSGYRKGGTSVLSLHTGLAASQGGVAGQELGSPSTFDGRQLASVGYTVSRMGWWGGAVVGARNKPLQRAPPADKPVHGVLFAGDYRKSLYSQAFGHLICRSGGSTIGTAANPRRPRLSPDVTRPDPAVPIDESLTPSMTHPSRRLCAATAHPQRVKPRRRHHRAREPYCEPSERAWRACVARPGGWRWERDLERPGHSPHPLHCTPPKR